LHDGGLRAAARDDQQTDHRNDQSQHDEDAAANRAEHERRKRRLRWSCGWVGRGSFTRRRGRKLGARFLADAPARLDDKRLGYRRRLHDGMRHARNHKRPPDAIK
jgi:hypothetical protein